MSTGEDSIIKSFEERGIMNYVRRYRELRDKIGGELDELKKFGESPQEILDKFNELKKRAVNSARLVRKGDNHFIKEISNVIEKMEELDKEMELILQEKRSREGTVAISSSESEDPEKIKKYLKKLEELWREGKIPDNIYKKLKEDYESKLHERDELD